MGGDLSLIPSPLLNRIQGKKVCSLCGTKISTHKSCFRGNRWSQPSLWIPQKKNCYHTTLFQCCYIVQWCELSPGHFFFRICKATLSIPCVQALLMGLVIKFGQRKSKSLMRSGRRGNGDTPLLIFFLSSPIFRACEPVRRLHWAVGMGAKEAPRQSILSEHWRLVLKKTLFLSELASKLNSLLRQTAIARNGSATHQIT